MTDVLLYIKFCRDIVQDLGDLFSHLLKSCNILLWLQQDGLPKKVIGKLCSARIFYPNLVFGNSLENADHHAHIFK